MRRKKFMTITLSLILAASMTACGTQDTTTVSSVSETSVSTEVSVEETTAENEITFSDDSFSETSFEGSVTAVDGNTITVAVMSGNMGGGQMPGGDGTAPSMPEGSTDGQQPGGDGTAPSMPEGSTDGQMPGGDGTAPSMPEGSTDGQQPGGDGTAPADMGSQSGDTSVPEKPEGDTTGTTDGSAPSMPEGSTDGTMPTMPGGDGTTPDMSQFSTTTATIVLNDTSILTDQDGNAADLSTITEGTFLSITLNEDGSLAGIQISEGMGMGQPGGMSMSGSGVDSYTAVNEYTEDTDLDGDEISSTGTDENAVLVSNGATVNISNATVTRNSSDSTGGDNSSFYGVGAALLATDGTLNVSNTTITTDSAGGAGIFAYGDGVVNISDSTITTTQNTSGGIHVAGGGTLNASNLTVTTNGESAAAIRSDRGGGTMNVDGGSYTSNGVGSPAIYCTADITVANSELTANGSEAICIEGLNSLKLYDCDLTGNMADSEQNDNTWNIIVYQSMSGDSEVGNGVFAMSGGSITAKNGGMFYTTNTESTIYLSDVDMNYSDSNDFLLQCTGNTNQRGWGTAGANGADCSFTADDQTLKGNVIYDSISNLDFYLENGSSLTGAFLDDETWAGNGGSGVCNVYVDAASTWTVTGDSTVTNLYAAGAIVDANGNTVSIVGTDGSVYVSGTSIYTITVSSYSTDVDLSGAYTLAAYSAIG